MDSLQMALDLAAYVLLATMLLGLVFAVWLVWSIFLDRRFKKPRPEPEPLPNPAMEQLRATQASLRTLLAQVSGADRKELEAELRRGQQWQTYLEDRLERENEGYAVALRRLDRGWHQWKDAHERVWRLARDYRAEARTRLRDIASQYGDLEQYVAEERLKAVHRNRDAVAELHQKKLLRPPVLVRLGAQLPPQSAASITAAPAVAGTADPAQNAALDLPPDAVADSMAGPLPEAPGNAATAEAEASADLAGGMEASGLDAGALDEADLPPLESVDSVLGAPLEGEAADALVDTLLDRPANSPPAASQSKHITAADLSRLSADKAHKVYADTRLDAGDLPPGGLLRQDLAGSVFKGVAFTGPHRFRACNLHEADLRNITLERERAPHRFIQCDLSGVRFTGARMAYTLFYHCNLQGTDWRGVRLDRVKFEGCNLSDADWRGVNLSRTVIDPLPKNAQAFALAMKPPFNLSHPGAAVPRAAGRPGDAAGAGPGRADGKAASKAPGSE